MIFFPGIIPLYHDHFPGSYS